MKPSPPLRTSELARIHSERQSSVITTLLIDFPEPVPKHCLELLRNAPDSFDDKRYGIAAAAAYNLYLDHHPITPLSIQEAIAKSNVSADLSEIWNFLKLNPIPLPHGILEYECEELWHAYNYRRQATLLSEGAQALLSNPAQADSIVAHVRSGLDSLSKSRNGDGLPEIIDAAALLQLDSPLPTQLIEGILHKGSKMSLGGGSKTFKSWTFLNIALSVATGTDWLGFHCIRAKVLILNFEIAQTWMRYRLNQICQARDLYAEPGYLDFWNLRGFSAPHATIIPKIVERAKSLGYGLIIIDPSYKLIGQGDENSASDVGAMMGSFEHISVKTDAAVAFGAHFAKGNAAAKESIDRISGSGVFARDPDTILTFTPHEEPDCYTVEATLRNLPHLSPFVVRWEFPAFTRADDLDPANLKKKAGRPQSTPTADILDLLKPAPLTSKNWQKLAENEFGTSRASFFRILHQLSHNQAVFKSPVTGLYSVTSIRPVS